MSQPACFSGAAYASNRLDGLPARLDQRHELGQANGGEADAGVERGDERRGSGRRVTVAWVASRPMRRLRVARTAAAASGAITPTTGTESDDWSAGSAAEVAALQATTISFTPWRLEVAGDLVREPAISASGRGP